MGSTTTDLENGGGVATFMTMRLSSVRPVSPNWCIYRVPNRLRRILRMAYTPLVVSIGPLHHGNEDLKAMEEHKWRFLSHFVHKTGVDLDQYVQIVRSREREIRECYESFISFSSDKFVNLILLDAVFIIEIMLKLHYRQDFVNENNPFFNKPWIIRQYILPDLRLLENQIPFFIIGEIYERAKRDSSSKTCPQLQIPMKELCEEFLRDYLFVLMKPDEQREICIPEMKHFVDGLRKLCIPPGFINDGEQTESNEEGFMFTIPTITELHQAGVRFEAVTKNMFSIGFQDGILKIPKISLNNQTETLLRNIIAFEQCHSKNLTISNFILLTRLVDTDNDLDLLVEHNIIDRAIGDHSDVLMRIKTLAHEVAVDRVDVLFHKLSQDLKMYCKIPRHKWLANLRHIYFNTPWTTISMIVATVFLLLTLAQTVFSVLSFVFKK